MDLKVWNRFESSTHVDAAYLLDPTARYETTVATYADLAIQIAAQMRERAPPIPGR
jgi:hypothetical protein